MSSVVNESQDGAKGQQVPQIGFVLITFSMAFFFQKKLNLKCILLIKLCNFRIWISQFFFSIGNAKLIPLKFYFTCNFENITPQWMRYSLLCSGGQILFGSNLLSWGIPKQRNAVGFSEAILQQVRAGEFRSRVQQYYATAGACLR